MIHLVPGERCKMLHQTMTGLALSNPQCIEAKENTMLQPALQGKSKKTKPTFWKETKMMFVKRKRK